jgi:hypothetical protein
MDKKGNWADHQSLDRRINHDRARYLGKIGISPHALTYQPNPKYGRFYPFLMYFS